MKLNKITAALGFAHLLGMPAAAAARVEDDDKKDDKSAAKADDDDGDDASRAEDDSGDDKEEKKGKSAKAAKADGEDKDDGDDDKKAAKADDDDDGDDDGDGDGKEKAARKSERARCAAIFAAPAAGTRPDMAAHLAFNTSMSAKAAIDMLGVAAAGSAPPARGLASRMANVAIPNVGAGAPAGKASTGAAGVAAMIIEAGKARRGES